MKTFLIVVGMGLFGGCGGGGTAKPAVEAGVDAAVEAVMDVAALEVGLARVNYRVSSVEGTFTGDGINMVDATRTDTLARNTCTYVSPGTTAAQMAFIGASDLTKMLSVSGTVMCPPGMATSTSAAACTSQATNAIATLFQGTVETAGWADDSIVTFKILAPPSGFPACNYAGVVVAASQPWGITGTTTAGSFKSLTPFQVRFVGSKALTSGTNTSNVSWDFTMTVEPTL